MASRAFTYLALFSLTVGILLALAVTVYLKRNLSLPNRGMDQIEAQPLDGLNPALRSSLTEGTVDLRSEGVRARGYIAHDTGIVITNHHVVEAACVRLNCSSIVLDVESFASEGAGKSGRSVFEVVNCSPWLDVCILYDLTRKNRERDLQQFSSELVNGNHSDTLYVRPLKEDESLIKISGTKDENIAKVITGKKTESSHASFVASLATRKGYSGSPVFDQEGRLAGIVSAGGLFDRESDIQVLFNFLNADQADYSDKTVVVDIAQVQSLLLSKDKTNREELVGLELESFLKSIDDTIKLNSRSFAWIRILELSMISSRFFDDLQLDLMVTDKTSKVGDLSEIFLLSRPVAKMQSHPRTWKDHASDSIWLKAYALHMFYKGSTTALLGERKERFVLELLEIATVLGVESDDGMFVLRLLDMTSLNELDSFSKPSHVHQFLARAELFRKIKRQDLVLADAESALALDPQSEEALMIRGEMKFYETKDYKGAVVDLAKVLKTADGYRAKEAHHLRGRSFYMLGRPIDCLADLELAEGEIFVDFHRGLCLSQAGRDEEALVRYAEELKLFSNLSFVLLARAGALERLGRYEEALADLVEASARSEPEDAAGVAKRIANLKEIKSKSY